MKKNRGPKAKGFTLVEILVVVAIVGILATIAIPRFSSYRAKSYCAALKADLANLAISQEAYFYDNDTYLQATLTSGGGSNVPNFSWTTGVVLVSSAGDITSWNAVVSHPNCNDGPVTWNSANTGLQ